MNYKNRCFAENRFSNITMYYYYNTKDNNFETLCCVSTTRVWRPVTYRRAVSHAISDGIDCHLVVVFLPINSRLVGENYNECFGYRSDGEGSKMAKQQIEFTSPAWLHSSGWDHSLHTVLIVHGYGGTTEEYLPSSVLRDGQ